jgi:hypothetical protein
MRLRWMRSRSAVWSLKDERRNREAWERWADEPVAPVLRFSPIPAVWCGERLATGLTRDAVIAHARSRAAERGWVHVLMWNRRQAVWFYPDGLLTTVEPPKK